MLLRRDHIKSANFVLALTAFLSRTALATSPFWLLPQMTSLLFEEYPVNFMDIQY